MSVVILVNSGAPRRPRREDHNLKVNKAHCGGRVPGAGATARAGAALLILQIFYYLCYSFLLLFIILRNILTTIRLNNMHFFNIAYFINSTSESDHALNTFLKTTPVLLLFYVYFSQLLRHHRRYILMCS